MAALIKWLCMGLIWATAESFKIDSCVNCNSKGGEEESEEMALSSLTWGYARIIAGTLVGGTLGFYVMHRIEVSYKMQMEEALRQYEKEMKKRQEDANLGLIGEDSL